MSAAAAALLWIAGAAPPADPPTVRAVLDRGVRWLIEHQNENGSFGSHHSPRWYEVMASVPGSHEAFCVATTALCAMALRDAGSGIDGARPAAERALEYLLRHADVKRPSALEFYSIWSFGYTLQCLGQWLLQEPEHPAAERMRAACATVVRRLEGLQVLDGGFSYFDFGARTRQPSWTSMSFTTATVLIGLERARRAGIEVSDRMLQRGADNVRSAKTPDRSFVYGQYLRMSPRMGINQRKGSACRTPACLYALAQLGDPAPDREVEAALRDLCVTHLRFQQIGVRRPVPHEAWYSISGYFYLYGFAYASLWLERLPDELRRPLHAPFIAGVMYCAQPDGSFWDYPLYNYHKSYGTAYALLALSRVPPDLPAVRPPDPRPFDDDPAPAPPAPAPAGGGPR